MWTQTHESASRQALREFMLSLASKEEKRKTVKSRNQDVNTKSEMGKNGQKTNWIKIPPS